MNRTLLNTKQMWLMLIVLLGVSLQTAFAQVSTYTFAASTGTYAPITGGTPMVLPLAATTPFQSATVFNNDVTGVNPTSTGFPIGFTFKYNNTDFTNFAISANGFIKLGSGTFSTTTTSAPISSTLAVASNIIAPMAITTVVGFQAPLSTTTAGSPTVGVASATGIEVGARVFGAGVAAGATVTAIAGTIITLSAPVTATSAAALLSFTGEIRYQTSGTTPNRRLTVQWKNCARNVTAEFINYQLVLEETTNNVVFRYGDIAITASNTTQVGLKGFNQTDFNNRTTTTDWAATTAGTLNFSNCTISATVKPAIGQTYTFSPSTTTCVTPGGVNVTNLNSTSVTLNWASTPLATGGYNVEYRLTSAAPAGAFTVATGSPFSGTTANVTGLALSTAYQWRVQSVCAGPTTSTFLPAFFQDTFTTLSACTAPSTLTTTAITNTSATLSWVGNLTATNYTLEYRQVGLIPYTTLTIAGTTTNLTGLIVGTTYEWRVTSNCAGATPTAVSALVTFTTVCAVSSLPFSESFEGITAANQLPACMAASSLGNVCLTYIAAQTTYNRAARSGSKFAAFRFGTAATGDYFYTVPLQMTAGVTYQFSTWYVADGLSGWSNLDAWVGTNQNPTGLVAIPGASATNITNITYQELAGTFTVPTTGVYYVAIRAVGNFTPWYISLDDMFVGLPPACIVPNGVTTPTIGTTTATINWNAVVGSTGYNVQYRVVGSPTFTPFAGNPITVGTSANLTGLTGSTNYEVQVQNICTTVLSSTYSFSSNFTTACVPINVFPYFEGFEGISVANQFPNCMAKTARTFTEIAPASFNRAPRTGTKYGYFQWGSTAGGDYIYSAPLALIAGKTYDFSVWYSADGVAGWTNLDAWVGPNQNPTGLVAITGASTTNIVNMTYQQLAGSFVPTTTGTYYVALRGVATGAPWYLCFDDLSVISPCVGAVFTTLTLPAGSVVSAYSQTIAATGGVAPYTFSVTNGALPAGLTLNPTTGEISGTPTVVNTTPPTFTVTVSDATNCTTNKTYSIVVTGVPCVAISITPTTVPAATLGVLYTPNAVQFVGSGVTGATYNYSIVSGILPSGMSLGSTTGLLTGTPTNRPASPTITVRARITTGTSAGCFGVITLDLQVNCPAMAFPLTTIPDAVINVPYSQQLSATYTSSAGPPPVTVTSGFTFSTVSVLPLGFTLSASGLLSGVKTTLSTPASIVVVASRTNGCSITQTYTFGVIPTIAAPKVLKPIQISSNSFRARWEPVDRAVKYRLYIATSPDFDGGSFAVGYVGLAVVGDTSILVQGLKAQTKYYIQVTAISSADEVSPYSNIENCTTLSAITGIDNTLSSQVKVAPNPSKDKFLVDFGVLNLGKTTARVYDAQGKQVLSSEIGANVNQTTISLGNMANGIYLLEIISNKGRILKRLVKE